MLEPLGRAALLAVVAAYANQQSEDDAGDGGVDAALVHQPPGRDRERHVDPRRPDPPPLEKGPRDEDRQRAEQGYDGERGGVEDGDDDDDHQVVDHGEGQQERAQRLGQVGADDREHRQREGDVRGRRDRPTARLAVDVSGVDRQVDERRQRDPARRRDDRHGGIGWPPERAHDELSLQLEPGDEEEQGEGTVRGPVLEIQRADGEVPEVVVRRPPRRAGPHHRHGGGRQRDRPADGLAPEHVAQEGALGEARLGEEQRATVATAGHGVLLGRRRRTCRPDFPAHRGPPYAPR